MSDLYRLTTVSRSGESYEARVIRMIREGILVRVFDAEIVEMARVIAEKDRADAAFSTITTRVPDPSKDWR